jgi:pyruvate kinase
MVTSEAIASSAVKTALDMDAKMLVVLTESGNTARMVAKYRPKMPILVLTPSKHVAQQCFGLLRGTECRVVGSMMGTAGILIRAAKIGIKCGFLKPGETFNKSAAFLNRATSKTFSVKSKALSNTSLVTKRVGSKYRSIAHNSCRLFCNGVPLW